MPDWLVTLIAVIITAIVAPILVKRFAPKWQRQKTEAETDSEVAETVVALTTAWGKLLATLQGQLEVAEAGIELRDEEIRNWEEKYASLYESYSHASAYLTAATTRLALFEGRAMANNKAEGNDDPGQVKG